MSDEEGASEMGASEMKRVHQLSVSACVQPLPRSHQAANAMHDATAGYARSITEQCMRDGSQLLAMMPS